MVNEIGDFGTAQQMDLWVCLSGVNVARRQRGDPAELGCM